MLGKVLRCLKLHPARFSWARSTDHCLQSKAMVGAGQSLSLLTWPSRTSTFNKAYAWQIFQFEGDCVTSHFCTTYATVNSCS